MFFKKLLFTRTKVLYNYHIKINQNDIPYARVENPKTSK